MHDIDRVRLETQYGSVMSETGPFEQEQFEFAQGEASTEVFGETEEMELASELLEITNEAELDRFLGDLISRAGRAIGNFVRTPQAKAIGGLLKGAAKQVLPGIGSAVGSYFGGATGAKVGGDVASAAARAFGLELEGLSNEDRDFELARRYVSFAGEAVKSLAAAPPHVDPRAAASSAAVAAAKALAPGLLRPLQTGVGDPASSRLPTAHSGRWMRRGNKIILYGI